MSLIPSSIIDLVSESLLSFHDPYLHTDYISLNCLQDCTLDDEKLSLEIHLPYPCEQVAGEINEELEAHLAPLLKEHSLELISHITHKIVSYHNENAVKPMDNIKNIIAVASGKGGVGKSTTAINLALALQQSGASVGVLDADIYGPNLALMMGIDKDQRPKVEAEKYFLPIIAYGLQTMSMSYVTTEQTPIVWRGPKASGAFSQLLNTTLWNELDYLIVDMPPGTGDIQLTLSQSSPVTAAVVVTTPQNMATQDARKGIEMFKKVNVPVLGVIENMSTHVCSECGHEEYLFGEGGGEGLAGDTGVNFLGALPLKIAIREGMDKGVPIAAGSLSDEIGKRYLTIALNIAAQLSLQLKARQGAAGIKLVEG